MLMSSTASGIVEEASYGIVVDRDEDRQKQIPELGLASPIIPGELPLKTWFSHLGVY